MALLLALSIGAGSALAQTADNEADEEDEVFTLTPFEVTSQADSRYGVKDSLAGGRIRTSLKDTPSSLSVITAEFLEDVNVNNAEDLLVYTLGTEVGGLYGNFSGLGSRGDGIVFGSVGAVETGARLVNPGGVNRARGLTSMDNTRNYFPSDIPWDGYNIERVEISRGPNSFLYGTGSPSGISNVSTRNAVFDDLGSIEFNYGSFGSTRESIDFNKQVTEELAIRLDLMNSNSKYRQKPAFRDMTRGYVALRYDPKFLKTDTAYTQFKANFEHGEGESNSPRTLPPIDYVTGYLNDPRASETGIDPWMYTQGANGRADPEYSYWSSAGSVGNQYMWGNNPQLIWDGESGQLYGAGVSAFDKGPGSDPNTWNVHSSGFHTYAATVNQLYVQEHGEDGGDYPGAAKGTISYHDRTLSDPSVFDFYNKLIDGDTKREWQDWDAYNVRITQGLFENRLTFDAVLDHQEYSYGYYGLFTNRTPILMLDLNENLLTGNPPWLGDDYPVTPNPNVGRPLFFADQGKEEERTTTRDNYQVTVNYMLDFQNDLGMDGVLGQILGKHNFTGLWSKFERYGESESYNQNGVDYSFYRATGSSTARPKRNYYNWLAYVGPSLLGTTGQNANLSNMQSDLTPPSMVNFNIWSDVWKDPSVDPDAEWVYTDKHGEEQTGTQADNPANYVGFVPTQFSMINGDSNPSILATGGDKSSQVIESKAIMYQGHFWNDTIIPSFGYREDTTKQNGAIPDPDGDILDLKNYEITGPGVSATTNSMSYGVAVHLPKAIKERLPSGTDLTFYYFHGENETPRVRFGLDGQPLDNESGVTNDYSVQFDGLDGRLTARLTYFTTKNENSTMTVGEPLSTYMVGFLPQATVMYGAYALATRDLGVDENGKVINAPAEWDGWMKEMNPWWEPRKWAFDNPEAADAFEEAMQTVFVDTYPQSYWDAWSYNVDAEAIRNGDWLHVVKGTTNMQDWNKIGGSKYIAGEWPTIDQNLESKGYELEVTLRPLDGWDISFNGSKVDATQSGFGAGADRVLNGMADVYLGSGVGNGAYWDTSLGAFKRTFLNDIWVKYLKTVALVGGEQPEMRKYRFNTVTNYYFKEGAFKGLNIGAAYRWEDKAIVAYRPGIAEVYGESAYIADVKQPLYGPTDQHVDLWAGYEHKLNDNVDWKIQLNVRNVGEKKGLVPVAFQPNGDVAQSRITEGMGYNVSVKFSY